MECCRPSVWVRGIGHENRRYNRLEAFKMWIWRRMENINWIEHNEEVIEEERAVIHAINEKQRKWIGHMLRGDSDSLLRTVIKGKLERN